MKRNEKTGSFKKYAMSSVLFVVLLILLTLLSIIYFFPKVDEADQKQNEDTNVGETAEYPIIGESAVGKNLYVPAVIVNQEGKVMLYEIEELPIEQGVEQLIHACLKGVEKEKGFQPVVVKVCDPRQK